jgi:hypothetical protein
MPKVDPGRHRYSVGGRPPDTGGAINDVQCALWNPASPPNPIYFVAFFHAGTVAAGAAVRIGFNRITTRGTPATTVTPTIENDWEDYVAPTSGAVLDLCLYSVQPTLSTPYMGRWHANVNPGECPIIFIPVKPYRINPGEGLAISSVQASIIGGGDVTFEWTE